MKIPEPPKPTSRFDEVMKIMALVQELSGQYAKSSPHRVGHNRRLKQRAWALMARAERMCGIHGSQHRARITSVARRSLIKL